MGEEGFVRRVMATYERGGKAKGRALGCQMMGVYIGRGRSNDTDREDWGVGGGVGYLRALVGSQEETGAEGERSRRRTDCIGREICLMSKGE